MRPVRLEPSDLNLFLHIFRQIRLITGSPLTQAGRLIRRGWFRRQAMDLFQKHYSDAPKIFVFSHAWFTNFQKRWSISSRAVTRKASKIPEEYQQLILQWLRFNRRNSQPRNAFERDLITTDMGRY